MGILDVKEITASIIKSGINMEYPSGMVIKAIGGMTALLSV